MSPYARGVCSGVVILLLACGSEPQVASQPAGEAEPVSIAGMWAVEGVTVEKGREAHSRTISGTVILTQEGDQYSSTFTMKTMFPTEDGASLDTDVIGKGQGTVQGRTIRGSATTQLVMATVPGVDTAFAYIPRTVSTRLVSSVAGELTADGKLRIEIENSPDEGEVYRPTRTTLTGSRIASGTPPEAAPE